MTLQDAQRLAHSAQNHALTSVQLAKGRRERTERDRYDESMALAVLNLSQAFLEFVKAEQQPRR